MGGLHFIVGIYIISTDAATRQNRRADLKRSVEGIRTCFEKRSNYLLQHEFAHIFVPTQLGIKSELVADCFAYHRSALSNEELYLVRRVITDTYDNTVSKARLSQLEWMMQERINNYKNNFSSLFSHCHKLSEKFEILALAP